MEPDSIRHHFKAQVPGYPGLMKRLVPYFDEQREIMLGLIPFDRGASIRILDLGCGPGLLAARLLSRPFRQRSVPVWRAWTSFLPKAAEKST